MELSVSKQLWIVKRLQTERGKILREALAFAISRVGVRTIDAELAARVDSKYITILAQRGLRGERLFPVPSVIRAVPSVAGYYRLLLGISGKQYERNGLGKWLRVERGEQVTLSHEEIEALCGQLTSLACQLLEGISADVSDQLLHELTLLTLGAQLDGAYRTVLGQQGAIAVREIILRIIEERSPSGLRRTSQSIEYTNAAGRRMVVKFGSDPDVQVFEIQGRRSRRPVLAIEVKSGTDASNLLNRLGEAEKSHLKLRGTGIVRWTIVGVPLDESEARQRSPNTDRFFVLSDLLPEQGSAYEAFKRDLVSLLVLKE